MRKLSIVPAQTFRSDVERPPTFHQSSRRLNGAGIWIGEAVETKQQILKAIEDLPDDAGVEDALDRLYLLYKVERGLRQADQGELLTQEELRERMAKWRK